MGSDSDLPIVRKAYDTLKQLEIPAEVHVYSAHRTPSEAKEFAACARKNGFGVIIAAAGMAAHFGRGYRCEHYPAGYRNTVQINKS